MKLTHWDKLLIIFLIGISAVGFIYNITAGAQVKYKYITINVDSRLVARYFFEVNKEKIISFRFGPNEEHEAKIELKDGRARLLPLPKHLCPRGICSHIGWIESKHETIVCIPNRIIIAFDKKDSALEDIDGVTF